MALSRDGPEDESRRRGLPLGNQTSQLFTDVYLNPFDYFICRGPHPARYARYVDDLVLFADSADKLDGDLRAIEEFLVGLRLRLHEAKCRIYRTKDGFTFLGLRIMPGQLHLVRSNAVNFRPGNRAMHRAWNKGRDRMVRGARASRPGRARPGTATAPGSPTLPDPAGIPPGTFPDELFDNRKQGRKAELEAWFRTIMRIYDSN